jgi:class 3 adenylate cyclase
LIDVHTAAQSLEDAHAAIRRGELSQAWGAAVVSATISRRPFLASEDAPWIRDQRRKLRRILNRSLDYLAEVTLLKGDSSMASSVAEEAISLEPLHEKAYQQLMRAHHLAGNDAEAMRVYRELRELLIEELGVPPSSATEEVKDQIMRRERRVPTTRITRTFVFTDIVSSTQLIEAMGDEAWTDVLRWHDETLRSCFLRHEGEEIDHAGDGFFVTFHSERQAMDCAISIQRALRDHRRAHGFAPSVRIGLHTSEATPQGRGYRGKGVHEAARIAALAQGGQIMASVDTIIAAGAARELTDRRIATLKGISKPLDVAAVDWQ